MLKNTPTVDEMLLLEDLIVEITKLISRYDNVTKSWPCDEQKSAKALSLLLSKYHKIQATRA